MPPFWVQINSTHFGVIGQSPIWGYYPFYLKAIIMTEDQSAVVTLKVRVTPEFREKIVSTAKNNNRSMNQEIVARLEESFTSGLVASDPYKRMLLAVIAGILAEQADREKPSFKEAIDRIVKAIMIDENTLQNRLGTKKAP